MIAWSLWEYDAAFSSLYHQCDDKLREKIEGRMALLMERGNAAREPISKHLEDGIFELKADRKRVRVRFFYFFQPGRRIIFVHSVFKDQRTLDRRDIDRAKAVRDTLLAEPELKNEITQIH